MSATTWTSATSSGPPWGTGAPPWGSGPPPWVHTGPTASSITGDSSFSHTSSPSSHTSTSSFSLTSDRNSSSTAAERSTSSPPTRGIVVGVVGGILALILIVIVLVWLLRRRRKRHVQAELCASPFTSAPPPVQVDTKDKARHISTDVERHGRSSAVASSQEQELRTTLEHMSVRLQMLEQQRLHALEIADEEPPVYTPPAESQARAAVRAEADDLHLAKASLRSSASTLQLRDARQYNGQRLAVAE